MQISQLGLLFRANVLNQLAAKVELAARHYSPARFTVALTGIDNRERKLAHRFNEGRLSLTQLQHQAIRLAHQDVILNTRLRCAGSHRLAVERQPVEAASAFRSVLVRAYCQADATLKQQLGPLLTPETLRTRARGMLADAVWQGHLDAPRELAAQVFRQAHHEALDLGCSPDQLAEVERKNAAEILAFIADRQPPGPDEAWHRVRLLLQSANGYLRPAKEAPGGQRAPDSWLELSDAFWSTGGWARAYDDFRATLYMAVEDALEPGMNHPADAEQRCRRTFELLQFVRQRAPAAHLPGAAASRELLEQYAQRFEREAVERLVADPGPRTTSLHMRASPPDSDA